jgi:hypothetical protein
VDGQPMSDQWALRMTAEMMSELERHLFPGDGDEHGAVIGASVLRTARGNRLLARRLFLAEEGSDYVPGTSSHRHLTAHYVSDRIDDCEREQLAYLAVHNHGGTDQVGFSSVDLQSHERGYPAILDILEDKPVGGLVFARNAVAGDIWLPDRTRAELERLDVIGLTHRTLYPSPPAPPERADERYDRQTRLFGDRGQAMLRNQKVGIIGLGGIGSLINEYLARLGVGEIVAIDPDRIEPTNLSRVVGGTRRDTRPLLTHPRLPAFVRKLTEPWRTPKVAIAHRVARHAQPGIRYHAVHDDVTKTSVVGQLLDCDYVFLAADTHQARLVFNELVHQYLIPGVQVGAKVQPDKHTGDIVDVFSVSRQIVPGRGCLWCNGLISPARLQEEAESEMQRRRQRYVDDEDIHDPSVITLNSVAAAHAVDQYLFTQLGLTESTELRWLTSYPREGTVEFELPRHTPNCPECDQRIGAGPTIELSTKLG